jgi:hypothetical protein
MQSDQNGGAEGGAKAETTVGIADEEPLTGTISEWILVA